MSLTLEQCTALTAAARGVVAGQCLTGAGLCYALSKANEQVSVRTIYDGMGELAVALGTASGGTVEDYWLGTPGVWTSQRVAFLKMLQSHTGESLLAYAKEQEVARV